MALTVIAIEKAKPQDRPYKMADKDGLFLLIKPMGGKYWRWKYRYLGKEKLLSIGVFPEVTLAEAREKVHEVRKLLASGKDPSQKKKEDRRQAILSSINTFRAVAEEWHTKNLAKWSKDHGAKIIRRLELHVFPEMGGRPINEIKPIDMLHMLQKIEKRDTTEILRRVNQTCNAVFQYGIITQRCDSNPASQLRGALKPHRAAHYPTLENKELPAFLRELDQVETTEQNRLALRLLMLTFVRTGEMRKAKWEDIDLKKKVWAIPAENMKMRIEHRVPLSGQTLEVLTRLKEVAGNNPYGLLLPSQNRQKHPMMCENTINNVIKKMGYGGKLVGHGFRALASTRLNESGLFKPDVIERQLAHKEPNQVRASYNRAEYWDDRVVMMQWWADYLDKQRESISK